MKNQILLATLILSIGHFCWSAETRQFLHELEERGKAVVYCGDATHNSLISVQLLEKGHSTKIIVNGKSLNSNEMSTLIGSFSSTYNESLEDSLFTFGTNNGGSDFSQAGFHYSDDKRNFSFYYNLWFEGPSFALSNCQVL